jgi:ABC-type molybdate transport system substrate-binding protein
MGECDYGIIFASDLKKINNRYLYQNIPLNSHQEIIYSIGIITNNAINEKFISFLNSEKTKIKLIDQGFIIRP